MPRTSQRKLTARQSVLLERLTTLAELAGERKLPVDVLEILGFGSFFRAKGRPKDVDLLIRCTREHSRPFALFRQVVHDICKDVRYQYDYDRPLAAFLDEYDHRHRNMIPNLISLHEERALFSEWLEPYSWPMLFPKTFRELPAWDDPFGFTRRLLRRKLPKLNVAYYIYPDATPDQIGLRAGFTELIWSPTHPDARLNVLAALTPSRIAENTRNELQNFERQLFLLQATLTVLESEVDRQLGRPARTFSESCLRTLQDPDFLLTEEEAQTELGLRRYSPRHAALDDEELLPLVEQRRTEVKELWWKVEAFREVARLLEWRDNGYSGPAIPVQEFLASQLLTGKTPTQRAFLQGLLDDLVLNDS